LPASPASAIHATKVAYSSSVMTVQTPPKLSNVLTRIFVAKPSPKSGLR